MGRALYLILILFMFLLLFLLPPISLSLSLYRVSPMIREFVQSIDDREWQTQLFALLQKQTYNQVEVDLFELMCKVLDQNLFSQVDWARNTVFFKDLKVCFPSLIPPPPSLYHHHSIRHKPQPVFKLGAKSATCYVKPTNQQKKTQNNNKQTQRS